MSLVLIGNQGAQKSTTIKAMVPDISQYVEIHFDAMPADAARLMRGRLVGEIAELKGMHTRALEGIKAFMTRTHESWIPNYREFPTAFARRLLFIGSTNAVDFLADETGNRRFLPVIVGQCDPVAMVADRSQLWAEGRELFRSSGIRWQDAERLARDVHSDHQIDDPWAEVITKWLDCVDDGELRVDAVALSRQARPFTTGDVLSEALRMLPAQVAKGHEMRAATVLRALGFTKKRDTLGGRRDYRWSK
jgi:predicted P-loop ATPase